MANVEQKKAQTIRQTKDININPENYFTWASGWHSPIYCDNRKILSFSEARRTVYEGFTEIIAKKYPDAEVIAGVATGAIAHGVLVAEKMGKPFIYVRSSPKAHGLTNQVEGEVQSGAKVVVIEDLVSTGGSSLSTVEALREAGVEVLGMVAIFTYGFPAAEQNFSKAGVKLDTLSNYNAMIDLAVQEDYVKQDDIETRREWRENPSQWRQ